MFTRELIIRQVVREGVRAHPVFHIIHPDGDVLGEEYEFIDAITFAQGFLGDPIDESAPTHRIVLELDATNICPEVSGNTITYEEGRSHPRSNHSIVEQRTLHN